MVKDFRDTIEHMDGHIQRAGQGPVLPKTTNEVTFVEVSDRKISTADYANFLKHLVKAAIILIQD